MQIVKKRNICMSNQYYFYFDMPKIRSVGPVRQKIKLPLPKGKVREEHHLIIN